MPFDVGESVNKLADMALSLPIVSKVSKNPIYTGILITVAIIVIVMIIFRDIDADEPLYVLSMRAGFWLFLVISGLIFMHDKVLMDDMTASARIATYDAAFETPVGVSAEAIPVNVNFTY